MKLVDRIDLKEGDRGGQKYTQPNDHSDELINQELTNTLNLKDN